MRGRGPRVSCSATLIINIEDITTHPDPHLPSRHRQCQRHHHRYHQVNQNRNTIKPLLIFQIMKCFRWQSMIIDQFKLFSSEHIVDIKSIHNMLFGYYYGALFCHIVILLWHTVLPYCQKFISRFGFRVLANLGKGCPAYSATKVSCMKQTKKLGIWSPHHPP